MPWTLNLVSYGLEYLIMADHGGGGGQVGAGVAGA